jgi:hypothetical protein
VLLGDDAAGDTRASIAGLEALGVLSAAVVIGLSVHNEGASHDGVLGAGGQRNAARRKVHVGQTGKVGLDVAEVAGVAVRVRWSSVSALGKYKEWKCFTTRFPQFFNKLQILQWFSGFPVQKLSKTAFIESQN